MSRIKDTNYYQVSGWMLNRLQLKGTELQVFAIIHGFSQDGESTFNGSLNYLTDWLGTSKPTTIKALKGLVDKGYILKEQTEINSVTYNKYRTNSAVIDYLVGSKETLPPNNQGSKETLPGSKESLLSGSKETLPGGSKETLPNNKTPDNKSNNKLDNKKETSASGKANASASVSSAKNKSNAIISQKCEYGEFSNVFLTAEELNKLQAKFPDWQARIDELSCYIESSGKKYNSHYATILAWDRRKKTEAPKSNYRKQTTRNNDPNPDYSYGVEGVDHL